ncbi:Arachidonate 5-lipoxygenase, partial [Manacus vitellinus]
GTDDYVYLTLQGTSGCSERHLLDKPFYNDFERGAVDSYDVTVEEDLGEIQLIKIEKRKYWYQDDWYLKYVTVKTPVGDYLEFPCYRWITDEKEVVLRDGRGENHKKPDFLQNIWNSLSPSPFSMYLPIISLIWRQWGRVLRILKIIFFRYVLFLCIFRMENLYINRFMHMFQSSWSDFADFERIFVRISNTISEYVMQHWKEDFMFGYQFLNGCNPVLIQRCTEIPKKLPVTMDMVECSLERNLTLEEEVKVQLWIRLDCTRSFSYSLTSKLCSNCFSHISLQAFWLVMAKPFLGQKPGPDNPIFLPSDATYDWLLAKIWVRSSDFHIHQTVTHLLRTHLVSEVFSIAMFRQLPAVHPLFKVGSCMKGCMRARVVITSVNTVPILPFFLQANATGGGGHVQMVQKAMKDLTYRSLCFPEEIKAKGMDSKEDIPYYYYRDDGIKVWEAIKSFAEDVIHIYYESDEVVCEDVELQAFVKDIYVYGMRGVKASGFPKMIRTRETLAEYLTVIIFTASAQHAAVNFGQYDWCSWIPNAPPTMRCPPPTEKGTVTIEQIVESLPDRGRSCWHLGAVWALSQFQDKELFLGMYPDEHFVEKPVKEAMAKFRKNLDEIVNTITERNKNKKLPYYYLSPDRIPNSVAV